jgi:hypothetical protein
MDINGGLLITKDIKFLICGGYLDNTFFLSGKKMLSLSGWDMIEAMNTLDGIRKMYIYTWTQLL